MEEDTLYCEECGDQEQQVSFANAGLCDDCARSTASEIISEMFGYKVCGQLLYGDHDLKAICIIPYGTEHEHE